MSSMDAEPSETFSGNSGRSSPQTVGFSHGSSGAADTVTNGDNAVEQKQKGGCVQILNSNRGDNLHTISEASSVQIAERFVESIENAESIDDEEPCKDSMEDRRNELKEGSSENTSEALESEKHDSVAASAGSSPPPSSAAPDELHMDTDTKSNSEEGDNKEPSEIKNDSGKELDDLKTDGDGDDKTDTEEGEDDIQNRDGTHDMDISEKADDKAVDATDKKKEESAKRVLPKWMVQDADAPPSPKEEADEKDTTTAIVESESASGGRGRGRGRKGRDTTRAVAKPHYEAAVEQPQPESLATGRPRRSTRSNVDYAHPDVATIVAEQEDLENELQQKVGRSRGRGRGRGRGGRSGGRKRAVADSEDGEDSDSEYGGKKRKRAGSGLRGRGRGRGRGRPSRALGKKSSKDESEDDDEELDLSDNEGGDSTGSGEDSYKPASSKRRASACATEAHSPKQLPKKRGRASAAKMH